MRRAFLLLAVAACTHAAPPASRAPVVEPPSAACAAPEYRQFDFWDGDWDLTVKARSAPDSDQWGEANGHQHVEPILGGCATAEHFTAEGPQQPWAGASYSSWQPALGKWRQAWVDDSGGYLLFEGGLEDGAMTLYGIPKEVNGQTIQMRMRYLDVTPTSLRWEWQRSADGGQTWAAMMIIEYRRAP